MKFNRLNQKHDWIFLIYTQTFLKLFFKLKTIINIYRSALEKQNWRVIITATTWLPLPNIWFAKRKWNSKKSENMKFSVPAKGLRCFIVLLLIANMFSKQEKHWNTMLKWFTYQEWHVPWKIVKLKSNLVTWWIIYKIFILIVKKCVKTVRKFFRIKAWKNTWRFASIITKISFHVFLKTTWQKTLNVFFSFVNHL